MKITAHSGIYTLEVKQELSIELETCWKFFSNPANLSEITPNKMGFIITSNDFNTTYEGQIITYKIGLFLGIKSNWVTEITHIKENEYFVDEQRFGPYKMWHHEHIFIKIDDKKTLMLDKVSYKLPLGILGRIAHFLFVKRMLKNIFTYRKESLNKYIDDNLF